MRTPDDLSPEERRLAEYLERERTHGGWPEHLRREHPDLFPVHRRKRGEAADPAAVRRLLLVTVPLLAVLLLAEVTDRLISDAWLLALITALAAMSFYYGFLYRRHILSYYRWSAQGGFLVMLACFALVAYFGVREQHTVAELAALVDPIPEIKDVTYVPTAAELAAIEAIVRTTSGFTGEAGEDALPVARETDGRRYWLLETALAPAEAEAFYDAAEHRRGWTLDSRNDGLFVFHRGGERLTIFVRDDWPRPRTLVSYIYAPG